MDLWSEWQGSNLRPDGPKPIGNTFSARFWRFLVISYLFYLLFGALISTVSECSGAVCGNLCGQKRFPPGFRWRFTGAGREAFRVSDHLHCNSEQGVMQVVSAMVAAQWLRRYRQRNTRTPLLSEDKIRCSEMLFRVKISFPPIAITFPQFEGYFKGSIRTRGCTA